MTDNCDENLDFIDDSKNDKNHEYTIAFIIKYIADKYKFNDENGDVDYETVNSKNFKSYFEFVRRRIKDNNENEINGILTYYKANLNTYKPGWLLSGNRNNLKKTIDCLKLRLPPTVPVVGGRTRRRNHKHNLKKKKSAFKTTINRRTSRRSRNRKIIRK